MQLIGILLWTSKNGMWEIYQMKTSFTYYTIVNKQNGFIDYPIMYIDKTVAYDYPERIPRYVKDACSNILRNRK